MTTQRTASEGDSGGEMPTVYQPVQPHWFFCKKGPDGRENWLPFSIVDSLHLEEAFTEHASKVVPTNGGRFDVHIEERIRYSVYWEEESSVVRRCTWFFKSEREKKFIPYEEEFSNKLEEEFRNVVSCGNWHQRLEFTSGDTIVIHSPQLIVHLQSSSKFSDNWATVPESQLHPRAVRRGLDDQDTVVETGESIKIDHLVFVVHGIGSICDFKFRTLPEVVDLFRNLGHRLVTSHYDVHQQAGTVGRVEFLPVSWHYSLHSDIDVKLQPITLASVPKLRHFANDTILDVLFYTSPVYCQAILDQVGSEINRLYRLFLSRNASFTGGVSLAGHSLGSVIIFDLLLNQSKQQNFQPDDVKEMATLDMQTVLDQLGLSQYFDTLNREHFDFDALTVCSENDLAKAGLTAEHRRKLLNFAHSYKEDSKAQNYCDNLEAPAYSNRVTSTIRPRLERRQSTYLVGMAGTGQPIVTYPRLAFEPKCFFAFGSPVAMFLTVRGVDVVRNDFQLPNCKAYFNIFHPYDPVAYRVEPLLDPSFTHSPVMIPHHKGRKRMHIEIKESLSRIGADIKSKLIDSFKYTWDLAFNNQPAIDAVDDVLVEAVEATEVPSVEKIRKPSVIESVIETDEDGDSPQNITIGMLNAGRRIDYVLQEAPIESFNEYLFAMQSHICYWESEDTVLLLLREIYGSMGISPNYVMPDQHPLKRNSGSEEEMECSGAQGFLGGAGDMLLI